MSKLLYSFCVHPTLGRTKLFSSVSRTLFTSVTRFNKDGDDKNNNDTKIVDKEGAENESADKRREAQEKLQDLLKLMSRDNPVEEIPEVQVPRPRVEAQKKYRKMKEEYLERKQKIKKESIGNQLQEAATKVAERLGGNTKQTEMELLELYLGRTMNNASEETTKLSEDGSELSVEEVPKSSMKDLLLSLEVEKETPKEQSRAYQVRVYKKSSRTVTLPKMPLSRARAKVAEKIDLFGAEPFNFFTTDQENVEQTPDKSVMWNFLQERDLRLSVTHPPANIFEQLILWTEQGKIWKFPINNEQDWEEENVDFTEHVFLEHMLEPWCPSSGLIRHFMELVCVGLSKNPYISVQEKHAHIIFYEHYFRQKNSLLVDLGMEPIKDRPRLEESV